MGDILPDEVLAEEKGQKLTEEETAGQQPGQETKKKERKWPGKLNAILLVLFLAVVWFYFAAMITGHDGAYGPLNLLKHKQYGQAARLFTAMVTLILLLNLKMKIVSWQPARNLVLIISIFVGLYVVTVSIWPQFKPRSMLADIPKILTTQAQATPPPAKTWQTVYGPKEFTGIGYKKGEFGDGGIRTVQYNQDMIYGDKVIITGKSFEVWRGQWKKYNERVEIINKNSNGHGFLFARASLNKKITIAIKRLME